MRRTSNSTPEASLPTWEEWVHSNRAWLRSVIFARLGRSDWTDDVLSEVSLAVAKSWAHVQPHAPRAWLRRVAVTQSLLFRRRLGRAKRLEGKLQRECLPGRHVSVESPLNILLHHENSHHLQVAIGRLSARDREALLLKFVDELTYAEIAERWGATTAAVASRTLRARQALRRELAQLGCTGIDS